MQLLIGLRILLSCIKKNYGLIQGENGLNVQYQLNGLYTEERLESYHFCSYQATSRLEGSRMADVKSIGIIFLVYFTIFANAGNTFCKDATKKLGDLETLVRNLDCGASQGTTNHCFLSFLILYSASHSSFRDLCIVSRLFYIFSQRVVTGNCCELLKLL